MWVYCAISTLWLISSITLLTSNITLCKYIFSYQIKDLLILLTVDVRYVNLRNANYFLFVWIFLTVALSILDLGLGVAFGIDYDTLRVNKVF